MRANRPFPKPQGGLFDLFSGAKRNLQASHPLIDLVYYKLKQGLCPHALDVYLIQIISFVGSDQSSLVFFKK